MSYLFAFILGLFGISLFGNWSRSRHRSQDDPNREFYDSDTTDTSSCDRSDYDAGNE